MLYFAFGFEKAHKFNVVDIPKKVSFSVIIPFRNESENLPQLLDSIIKIKYPSESVEFIFVDDDSTDNSLEIIQQYIPQKNIRILANKRHSDSPKKDAIQTAIGQAKHEWIITTDADCILPKSWLKSYNAYIQEYPAIMIAGPVKYSSDASFLHSFQQTVFHTLQAVTIGSFGIQNAMMCNGANLAYTKTAFKAVQGFKGNQTIASGDDIFMFEKMYQLDRKKVHFLKSKAALVTTTPQNTWSTFIEQQVRWASKSTAYQHTFTKSVGVLVLICNLMLVISCFLTLLNYFSLLFLVIIFGSKIALDSILLVKFHRFFIDRTITPTSFLGGIIYPFINVFIALLSLYSGYTWKDRYFTK
jgi:cellulose synthase/poly-beta-1,6-N-acetylglucosamine synthase-like glycosyltransferase